MLLNDRATIVQAARDEALVAEGKRRPLKTGACFAGWHEGSKPHTRDGEPVKTCELYKVCPCQCHLDMDELYEMSGQERILIDNPEYHRVVGNISTYTLIETPGIMDVNAVIPANVLVSPAPGIVPGALIKEFTPTPTGRFARGEVEFLVKSCTDTWVIENDRHLCTPSYIADNIAKLYGIEPPQLGSIAGVFNKWKDIGFATVEQGPARFSGYTADAIEMGLDRMHERSDRATKIKMAF